MIKLTELIKEEKTFKAKSKESGRIVVYKSKESMEKAIKDGRAEPIDKKKSDKKVKGADLFAKDVQKKKTDTNVKVLDDDGKEVTLSPKEQELLNKSKKVLDSIENHRKTTSKLDGTEQEVINQIARIKRGEYYSGGDMVKLSKKEQKDALDAWTKAVQKMYDDGVFGGPPSDNISREDIKPENSKKISDLISKAQNKIREELKDAGFSEFRGNFYDYRDVGINKKVKEVPKVSTAKVSKQVVKSVNDLANKIEKNIDDAYGDLDSDERDDFAITLQNVGTFLEDEINYDDLSQEDRKELDELLEEIELMVSHLQNDESGMGSIEGDPREVSKRAVEFIKKLPTKNEGVIKLTDLIKENKRKDLLMLSKMISRKPSDVTKFLKKYKLDPDDLLDVLDAGSSSQRRRYSMAILAAMKGNRRALRDLDNLLGFL